MAIETVGSKAAIRAVMAAEKAGEDATDALTVYHREVEREEQEGTYQNPLAPREPSRRQQLAGMTYADLVASENRTLLDQVVRAVATECDLDYLEALEQLQDWHDSGGTQTLGQMLNHLEVDAVFRDVIAMEERETPPPAPEVEMLDSSDPERQVSIEATDELGRVVLADGVDRARLLTDPYTIERAWLRAQELDDRGAYAGGADRLGDGLTGRERFEVHYREHIEEGADLVASLEAAHRHATAGELSAEQQAKVAAADRRAPTEREKRAEQHRLEDEIAERQERLGRL